jgi:hypothetical protein
MSDTWSRKPSHPSLTITRTERSRNSLRLSLKPLNRLRPTVPASPLTDSCDFCPYQPKHSSSAAAFVPRRDGWEESRWRAPPPSQVIMRIAPS